MEKSAKQKDMWNIGIVGCGNISDTHAKVVSALPNCTLAAACTRNRDRLEIFCRTHDTMGYRSYEKFLSHPNLDIVVICTPSGTHLDYGLKAAESGKHVIVEKPIEITVTRGLNLVEACQKNGVKLSVIYQNRFMDSVAKMNKLLHYGEIGDVFMASASVKWFRDQQYYDQSDWRGTFALDGGGAVINQSIHTIDLLQWMLGDVESVYGYTANASHSDIEAEDNATATIRFQNGVIAVFQASTSIVPAQERRIEFNGEKGTLLLRGDKLTVKTGVKITGSPGVSHSTGASGPLEGLGHENHLKQYQHIIRAISENTEPVVSGRESLKSLAVVEAIYKSSKERTPIDLDHLLPI
ncbi:MAG: Gfo/Idh/MocA family protein [Bacteroidota bacterium]